MMKLRARIQINATVTVEHGNKKGFNNWMKRLHEKTQTRIVDAPLEIDLNSDDYEMNELLSRIKGMQEVTVEWPWNDIPEQPKCNGTFDRVKGEITHFPDEWKESCPVHTYVPQHTHNESGVTWISTKDKEK